MKRNSPASRKDQLILVNINEELVRLQVRESIKELGACDCKTCYFDSCALALNTLEPKYVTTTRGALLSEITALRLNNQSRIVVEVTKAIMQVMKSPRH